MPGASKPKGRVTEKGASRQTEFRLLFESNPLPLWIFDEATLRFLEVNGAAVEKYGYSRAEFLKMQITDISPPEDAPALKKLLRQGRGKVRLEGVWRHRLKNKHLIDVEIVAQPVLFDGRKARLSVARDVTDQQRTGEQLEESQARLAALIDTAMDGIVMLDEDQRIVVFNAAAESIFRCTAAQVLGKPIDRLIPARFRKAHREHIRAFADEGVTRRRMGSTDALELVGLRSDGEEFPAEISIAVFENRGRRFFTAIVHDISARKEAEQGLRAREKRYRALAEAAHDMIVIIDRDGRLEYVNRFAAQQFDREPPAFVGERLDVFFPPDIAERQWENVQKVLATGEEIYVEAPTSFPGRVLWLGTRLVPIHGDAGDPDAVLAVSRDITERKLAQEALEKSIRDYRYLFEEANDAILIIDPENEVILEANSAACATYGFSRDELIGMSLKGLTKDVVRGEAMLRELLQTGAYRDFETVHFDKHRHELYFLVNASLIEYRGRKAVLALNRDITERKRAEEITRAGEERYRSLFENMLNGFSYCKMIFDGGRPQDFVYLDVNRAFEALTGLKEVVGKRASEVIPGILESDPELIGIYGRVASTGQPEAFETFVAAMKMWFSISVYSPEKGYFVAVFDVITERKQAEQKIRRQVSELEALYRGGLALSQTFDSRAIAEQVIIVLAEWLDWHHAAVRVRREGTEEVELLAYSHAKIKTGPLDAATTRARQIITRVGQGLAGWVILHGETVRRSELESDERYVRTFPGMRSGLYVPMKIGGRTVGCISVESPDPDAFSEEDERLLTTMGVQAAVALENARLFSQTERRAEEFTVLYEVTRDLGAQTDLGMVLSTVADRAAGLLRVNGGGVYLYDSRRDELEMVAANHPSIPIGLRLKMGEGLAGRVAQTRTPQIVDNYRHWEGRSPQFEGISVLSVAEVPMIYAGELLGVLVAETIGPEPAGQDIELRRFTEGDLRLLSLFAGTAAAAVYNARLIGDVRRNAGQLITINALGRSLAETFDLSQVYERLANAALVILPETESLQIGVVDAEGGIVAPVYVMQGGLSLDVSSVPASPLSGEGMQSSVVRTGTPLVVDGRDADAGGQAGAEIRPAVCVPLTLRGNVIGVLELRSRAAARYSPADADLLGLMANTAAIAIENARLFAQTERRVKQLSSLHVIDAAISSSTDLNMTLRIVLEHAIAQLGVDAADVLLLNLHTLNLTFALGRGFRSARSGGLSLRLGESQAGVAALERRRIFIPDLRQSGPVFSRSELFSGEDFVSFGCIPLIVKGEVKGVLEVFNRTRIDPDDEWLNFLELLAGQMAIAIDNSTLFDELQRSNIELTLSYDAAIEGLSRALDVHDAEIQGHSARVSEIAVRLARSLGMKDAEIMHLRHGALLHDIGQVGVPDAILKKAGPLDDAEWAIVRRHPQHAHDILMPIASLRASLDVPYCHHERWDGSGYPRGLVAQTIPLAARIFTVVDVFDALISNRPYREAWLRADALAYVREQSGKQFDPDVVEAFFRILPELEV